MTDFVWEGNEFLLILIWKDFFYFQTVISALLCYDSGLTYIRVVLNLIAPERLVSVYCVLYFKIRVTVSATFSVIFCIIHIETAFTAKQTAQIQQAEENIPGKN